MFEADLDIDEPEVALAGTVELIYTVVVFPQVATLTPMTMASLHTVVLVEQFWKVPLAPLTSTVTLAQKVTTVVFISA